MQDRVLVKDISSQVGNTVVMAGWVHIRRDQGKMVFFDLRDRSGILQCVVLPNHTDALEIAKEIRPEWVLEVTGIVNKRPEKNINPNKATRQYTWEGMKHDHEQDRDGPEPVNIRTVGG